MAKKKKIVYETGDDGILSQEERNKKDIQSLNRRICKIDADLYASDSECALRQIPELKKRLDNLFSIIAMNDNEFRIFRDAVFSMQREIYPLVEACELQKKEEYFDHRVAFIMKKSEN